MKNLINKVKKSPFIKNVALMVTGAAGAQIITMALSPFVTRLYGPEAFGIMGTFSALTQIIIPIAALTYPIAIVLPRNDENAKSLAKLSLFITLVMAILTSIIILFFNEEIIKMFQLQEISSFLLFIPIVIIFAGIMQVSEQWLIRVNQFAVNAKASFLQSLITNGSKVGMGLIYPTAIVLVILQVMNNGIKALMLIMLYKKTKYKSDVVESKEKIYSMKELAIKHKDFPIYRSPQVLLGAISDSLPILLLTSLFGPASAGFYNIGRTVLGLPSRLIGQAVGDVFYPRISDGANNGENITKLIKKATLLLFIIGIIPFGSVIVFGPWLFEFVFGSGWEVAGEYARWISLTSFVVFINKPAVRSMPVLNAQRLHLIYTIIIALVRCIALIVGFYVFNSDIIAIALFGLTSVILNIFLYLLTIKISKRIS